MWIARAETRCRMCGVWVQRQDLSAKGRIQSSRARLTTRHGKKNRRMRFACSLIFQESWFWSPGYERIYASLILGWAATRMCMRRMQNATSRISYPGLREDGAYVMHPTSPKKHVIAYLWLCPDLIGARSNRSGTRLWPSGTRCSSTQIGLA